MEAIKDHLTTAEVARELGVDVKLVQAWTRTGAMPSKVINRNFRIIPLTALKNFTRPRRGRPKAFAS